MLEQSSPSPSPCTSSVRTSHLQPRLPHTCARDAASHAYFHRLKVSCGTPHVAPASIHLLSSILNHPISGHVTTTRAPTSWRGCSSPPAPAAASATGAGAFSSVGKTPSFGNCFLSVTERTPGAIMQRVERPKFGGKRLSITF